MIRSVIILQAVFFGVAAGAGGVMADPSGPAVPPPPVAMPPAMTPSAGYPTTPTYATAPGYGPYAGRPLTGYDHVPFTGYGPLAGFYPLPVNGFPPNGFAPPIPGPYTPHKGTLVTPPTDTYPRQKPLIRPLHDGPIINHLRTALDIHARAPEGCPEPLGCSNLYTEFGFIFGSCRQFFGTAESTYGEFHRTYILP